jgi:hypothetical protein
MSVIVGAEEVVLYTPAQSPGPEAEAFTSVIFEKEDSLYTP